MSIYHLNITTSVIVMTVMIRLGFKGHNSVLTDVY